MLSIAHAVSGAFIASQVENPLLYIPLCLICHYAEDFIRHWDFGTGMKNGVRKKWLTVTFATCDLLFALLLIALIWRQTPSNLNPHLWWGAFFCVLPDFLEFPRNFLGLNWRFLKPLDNFHERIHHSTSDTFLGLIPQLIVVIFIWCLVG